MNDDIDLEADGDASDVPPDVLAAVFRGIADAYEEVPEDNRYDFEFEVTER